MLTVDDLRPSAREQVRAGLPSGTKDDATEQMRRLVASDPARPAVYARTDADADPDTAAAGRVARTHHRGRTAGSRRGRANHGGTRADARARRTDPRAELQDR